jgi:hypothetical protein
MMNRILSLVAALSLLPLIQAVPVTFQVDLSVQQQLGNFDPATDTVIAAGTFDGWSTTAFVLEPKPGAPTLYIGTYDNTTDQPGSTMQYKFIVNRSGTINWETRGNRTAALSNAAQTLPVAFFDDVSTSAKGGPVKFSVNMRVQREIGKFIPADDQVVAAGSFDNWSPGQFVLTNSPANPDVYSGVFEEIPQAPGATVEYKFIIASATAGANWESGNNRTFIMQVGGTNLPVVYFNNLTNNPGAGVAVTFQANLGVVAAMGNFSPDTDIVTVAGTFNNWNTTASQLTNSPSNPYVYSGTFTNATDAPGGPAEFKFLINGSTWESINNRVITLAPPAQSVPVLFFNNVTNLGGITIGGIAGGQFTLTWTAGAAIRLQNSTDLKIWTDVPDTLGVDTITVPLTGSRRFFRLAGP